ncbi:hypothetical protein H4219_005883 [Mycoemilia scoparia]|uniref:Uncharacterized protein n=1 Tax=Mycoemilia scoparia TaxID=417184 RepID=A0A9W7ZSL7_9FUNG|nr:hypothetical protein H4219_005883 [Mycoemilia scoparia]
MYVWLGYPPPPRPPQMGFMPPGGGNMPQPPPGPPPPNFRPGMMPPPHMFRPPGGHHPLATTTTAAATTTTTTGAQGYPPYSLPPPQAGAGMFSPHPSQPRPQHMMPHHHQHHHHHQHYQMLPNIQSQNGAINRIGSSNSSNNGIGSPQTPTTIGSPAAGGISNEKSNKLFIGSITPGTTDEWMQKLLSVCGKVASWKRLKDAKGNPNKFGFCEYEETRSVLRALRLLGGEQYDTTPNDGGQGILIPSNDPNTHEPLRLKVKADEKTRKYLDEYKHKHPLNKKDEESDKQAKDVIEKMIVEINKSAGGGNKEEEEEKEDEDNSNSDPWLKEDNGDDENSGESSWRKRHRGNSNTSDVWGSDNDAKRRNKSKSRSRSRVPRRGASSPDHSRSRYGRRDSGGGSRSKSQNARHTSIRWEGMELSYEEEEEWEKKEQQRHIMEMEDIFAQREDKWRDIEQDRIKQIQRDDIHDLEEVEKSMKDKEIMAKRLSEWDEKKEENLRREMYYRNRSEWWHQRKAFRNRELRRDDDDRKQEESEEKAKAEETEAKVGETARKEQPTSTSQKESRSQDDGDDQKEATVAAKTTIKLPEDRKEIFEWPVKWEKLEPKVIDEQLQPLVEKRLIDNLGESTNPDDIDELKQFVIEHVSNHNGPEGLIDELEMVLDEYAPILVEQVWRVIITETESL